MASLRTFVTILLVVAAAGCADQGGQVLVILNNAAPGADCAIDPVDGSGTIIPSGRVDVEGVLFRDAFVGYLLTPSIKNIATSDGGRLTTERTVILEGARVTVNNGNRTGGTMIEPTLLAQDVIDLTALGAMQFTAPFSTDLGPDGGLAGIPIEVLPREVVARAGGYIMATSNLSLLTVDVEVFGHTISGTNVESDPFTYPITLCHGCLFTYLGLCTNAADVAYPGGGECNVFQDQPSVCCTTTAAAGSIFTCPAFKEELGP